MTASVLIETARVLQDGTMPDERLKLALEAAVDWMEEYVRVLRIPRWRVRRRRKALARLAAATPFER